MKEMIPKPLIEAINQGDSAESQRLVNHYLNDADTPLRALLLKIRAGLTLAKGDLPLAQQDLDEALSITPDDPDILDNLGSIAQYQNQYQNAVVYHTKALKTRPKDSGIAYNLAVAYDRLGRKKEAGALYAAVLDAVPRHRKARINYAVLLENTGQPEQALEHLEKLKGEGEDSFLLWNALGQTYKRLERYDEAIKAYEKAVALDSSNQSVGFALAALKGETPDRPPENFVESLFDDFSGHFDETLTEKLNYKGPDHVFSILREHLPDKPKWRVCDLGAGTGLFGRLIRPYAEHAVGVDLSSGMLKQAQRQAIYDKTVQSDIGDYLSRKNNRTFDLMTAVDVLNYLGKLDRVFEQVARTLKNGGLFAFTVEKGAPDPDKDMALQISLRYAHSVAYIYKLAAATDLKIIDQRQEILRINKGEPITGLIYALRK